MKVNTTSSTIFSPVTLKESWSRSARLICLVVLATIGSIGNVFKISSILIDDYLRKKENYPIVSGAFYDLVMTTLVMPISSFFLLSGLDSSPLICNVQWFCIIFSFLSNNISMSIAAVENYGRVALNRPSEITPFTIMSLLLVLISTTIGAALGQIKLGYDYCERKTVGNTIFQITITITFIFTPILISLTMYMMSFAHMRKLRKRPNFKPSTKLQSDFYLSKTNFYCYAVFILMWLPFMVVFIMSVSYVVSDELLYTTAWVGIAQSAMSPYIYCATNRHFRQSFVRLFNYCFLKTNSTYSRRHRSEPRVPRDVRVHIIPGYNVYSPPRRVRNSTTSA